jgi:hypothetical protein
VANVNAHDAKKQRENLQASTDRLDLMGIATMLLNRRANCCPAQTGVYRNLRTLVRHRKKAGQDENRSPQPDPYDCRPPFSRLSE